MWDNMNFIDKRLRVFAISGIVVILAGVRFFIQGKDDIGAGSIIVGAAVILLGFFLVKLHGSGVKRLKTEGFCVDAVFESAERSMFGNRKADTRYNEWHYIIKCSWCDQSGVGHIYTDKLMLRFDPNFELSERKTIKVYIDRDNPSIYYMDLEFLKELDKRRR